MTKELNPQFVAVDKDGKIGDTAVLDENDIAYDPQQMTVDLTKDEKRRTTALMLAIQAYDHLIIKDAEMYNAISRDSRNNDGPTIRPATIHAMVEAALGFDDFISGRLQKQILESAGLADLSTEQKTGTKPKENL